MSGRYKEKLFYITVPNEFSLGLVTFYIKKWSWNRAKSDVKFNDGSPESISLNIQTYIYLVGYLIIIPWKAGIFLYL